MRYFAVKNLAKFQHYKERRPPWIKLHAELLHSYSFSQLPDSAKAHALCIFVLASQKDNRLPWDPIWLAAQINANSPIDLELLLAADLLKLLPVSKRNASDLLAPRQQDALSETEAEERQRHTGASRPKDELFEAIARECGIAIGSLTKSARQELNACRSQLKEAGATAESVRPRAAAYRAKYPTAQLTPSALAKHWPALVGANSAEADPVRADATRRIVEASLAADRRRLGES